MEGASSFLGPLVSWWCGCGCGLCCRVGRGGPDGLPQRRRAGGHHGGRVFFPWAFGLLVPWANAAAIVEAMRKDLEGRCRWRGKGKEAVGNVVGQGEMLIRHLYFLFDIF